MEITYDQRDPAQWAKTADAIGKIAEAFEGRMLVGAGTVTTPELVTRTRDAGGQFIISPDTNPAVIARTRELELVSMPGAMTPSEILAAHAAGADLVDVYKRQFQHHHRHKAGIGHSFRNRHKASSGFYL